MELTEPPVAAAPTAKPPASLEELGPSPMARHRRAQLVHAAWDVFHALCVCAVSLTLLAQASEGGAADACAPSASPVNQSTSAFDWFALGSAPSPPTPTAEGCPPATLGAAAARVWRVAAADPLEAGCACFTNFFMVSMCGNSPIAWLAAFSFASVDQRMWTEFHEAVLAVGGHPYEGHTAYLLGLCAFAAFLLPYVIHGGLLLPFEIWAPARDASAPYKIQPRRRVQASKIAPAVAHSILHLIFIGLPYIGGIAHVGVMTHGARGVRFDSPELPRQTERAWMLLAHLVVQHARSDRLGEDMAGHQGLVRLRLKARGWPSDSLGEAQRI